MLIWNRAGWNTAQTASRSLVCSSVVAGRGPDALSKMTDNNHGTVPYAKFIGGTPESILKGAEETESIQTTSWLFRVSF